MKLKRKLPWLTNNFVVLYCLVAFISVIFGVSAIYTRRSNYANGNSMPIVSSRSDNWHTVRSNTTYSQKDIGYGDGSVAYTEKLAEQLFPFDPNTADSTTLLRLGLKPWQVRNIYKYRAHGGRYYKKEDFARLYGLTLSQYRQLEPYIRIVQEPMAADVIGRGDNVSRQGDNPQRSASRYKYERIQKLTTADAKVDVNVADTTLLKRIPGIGSYFARRIVELRGQRKHFAYIEELLAIRNFPESALAYMTINVASPLLHVNTMTMQEMRSNPLLTYEQCSDILRLRRSTGHIYSLRDMRNIPSFTDAQLQRIARYLVFD